MVLTHCNFQTELSAIIETQDLSLKMLRVYCQKVLNFKVGERGVIANSRVLGPFSEDETFMLEDFALLEQFSTTSYGKKIKESLEKTADDVEDLTSNSYLKIVSILVSRPQSRTRFEVTFHGDEHSVLKIPPSDPNQVAFDVSVVVDPVSRGAQKVGPILQVLQEVLNCNIRVFLNSVEKNSDMPVKRLV